MFDENKRSWNKILLYKRNKRKVIKEDKNFENKKWIK